MEHDHDDRIIFVGQQYVGGIRQTNRGDASVHCVSRVSVFNNSIIGPDSPANNTRRASAKVFPFIHRVRITGLEPKYVVSGLLCCVISGYFLSLGLLSLWFPKVSLLWIVTSVATIGAWIWCFGYNYLGIGPKPTMPKLGNFVDDAKGVASLSSQPSSLENKDYVRFVCISDTHNDHKRIKVPDGDVLLHAGDFTKFGTEKAPQ